MEKKWEKKNLKKGAKREIQLTFNVEKWKSYNSQP